MVNDVQPVFASNVSKELQYFLSAAAVGLDCIAMHTCPCTLYKPLISAGLRHDHNSFP